LIIERQANEEVIEGLLTCSECEHTYTIHGGIPILTPPSTKPYDWLSRELTNALKQYEPREAIRMIAEGEIGPEKLARNEPLLTPKESKEGEYKDSEKFLQDRFGSIKRARDHFRRQHETDRKFYDMIIKMGRLDKADTILDIGTGYGYMLQFLAEHFRSAKIFSIGISYTNLKAVRGRLRIFGINHDIHLIAADALQPPFRNDQFETVESWAGQGNIASFFDIFGQVYRTLRNHGWFVTDIGGGLERADRDTRTLIETVGEEFFVKNLRKLGLLSTNNEARKTMKERGFHNISSRRVNSMHIISGRK